MPRRFFRRLSARFHGNHAERWYLKPFRVLVRHPVYLSTSRRSIAGAVAIGLCVGALPLPGHTPMVLAAGLLLRVNLAVALVTTFVSNPLTYAPLFYFEYRLGVLLLDVPSPTGEAGFTWSGLATSLTLIWKPLFLGAVLTAGATAVLGYGLTSTAWRLAVARRYQRRPGARRDGR